MTYKITKQFGKGSEITEHQTFKALADAKKYADQEAQNQADLKIQVTVRVYDFDEECYTITAQEMNQIKKTEDTGSADKQGQNNASQFNPSPFDTSPKPKGMPAKWDKKSENDDKNRE